MKLEERSLEDQIIILNKALALMGLCNNLDMMRYIKMAVCDFEGFNQYIKTVNEIYANLTARGE